MRSDKEGESYLHNASNTITGGGVFFGGVRGVEFYDLPSDPAAKKDDRVI